MGDGIYLALSGAVAQSTALETTAHNLANSSTDGYQRVRATFREVLGRATQKQPMHATTVAGTATDTTVGETRRTGGALDCALPKGSYLTVQTPRGDRFTRAGALHVGSDGYLAIASGEKVLGENGQPLKVDADAVLAPNGEVQGKSGNAYGRLGLVTFATASALVHEGGTLMAASAQSGPATPSKDPIEVGSVESSNAHVVEAMTDMIGYTRSFEAYERAIDAFRDADRKAATTVAGPQ
jgi:flagellar basal-body rod protein FlgF